MHQQFEQQLTSYTPSDSWEPHDLYNPFITGDLQVKSWVDLSRINTKETCWDIKKGEKGMKREEGLVVKRKKISIIGKEKPRVTR